MNKLDLVKSVGEGCKISRNEAAAVVNVLKFGDYVHSMLKITNPTKAEIPRPAKAFM